MASHFPILILKQDKEKDKKKNLHIQRDQQDSGINTKRSTIRHIVIKLSKARGKENLESIQREVTCHIEGIFNKISSSFSSETIEAKSQWNSMCSDERKKAPVNNEFYILHNYLSKMKEMLRHSQINQSKGYY